MKPITWHTATLDARVFARKQRGGPWHSGHLSALGRKTVTVEFDGGGRGKRSYSDVVFARELFAEINEGVSAVIALTPTNGCP